MLFSLRSRSIRLVVLLAIKKFSFPEIRIYFIHSILYTIPYQKFLSHHYYDFNWLFLYKHVTRLFIRSRSIRLVVLLAIKKFSFHEICIYFIYIILYTILYHKFLSHHIMILIFLYNTLFSLRCRSIRLLVLLAIKKFSFHRK